MINSLEEEEDNEFKEVEEEIMEFLSLSQRK